MNQLPFDVRCLQRRSGDCLILWLAITVVALPRTAQAVIVGIDDFDGNTNRIAYSQSPLDFTTLNDNENDMFGVRDRSTLVDSLFGPNTAGLPFTITDDSVVPAAGRTLFEDDLAGIFGQNKRDKFFGVVDLRNPSTNDNPLGIAEWTFDISGFSGLQLRLGIGAIGDFETADSYDFVAQIDGGTPQTLLSFRVDETATHTYRPMDSGNVPVIDDPLVQVGTGRILDKTDAATAALDIYLADITGTGSTLLLSFIANSESTHEAFGFDDLMIISVPEPRSVMLAAFGIFALVPFTSKCRRRRLRTPFCLTCAQLNRNN